MYKYTRLATMLGLTVTALMGAVTPVWSESAPVFDVEEFESMGPELRHESPMSSAPSDESAASYSMEMHDSAPRAATAPAPEAVGATTMGESDVSRNAGVSVSTANMSPEERMRRLEQQLTNLQNSESAQHVESLQTEVQTLRGQIELLNHQIDTMQAQQKNAKSSDGDTPKAAAGVGVATVRSPATRKSTVKKAEATHAAPKANAEQDGQPDVAEEQKIYQTAYDYIKAKKYSNAVDALQGMLKKYPAGQFASNAHYWLGELYGLMGKNDNAYEEFSTVIKKFPGSPRVSDAQLKLGLILAAQSKWPDAKRTFKQVINTYPGTASARLASEQLKQIKKAGH